MSQISGLALEEATCLAFLEQLRWGRKPKCPYCQSVKTTELRPEHRHHCNVCNTSFSVTVGTIFHKRRLDLATWFEAVVIVIDNGGQVSTRHLARRLRVNKNTACKMLLRIQIAMHDEAQRQMLLSITREFGDSIGGLQ